MTTVAREPVADSPSAPKPGSGPRRSGFRWASAGILDQAVLAIANAGTTLLAAALLDRDRSGALMVSVAVAYFAIGISRALVGEVLLALASRYDGERRDQLVRNGLTTAVCLGLVGSVIFVGLAVCWSSGSLNLSDLAWLAPFLPMVLLHDAGRYTYLADRRPGAALVIDTVWIGTQVTVVLLGLVLFGVTAGGLLVAWGLGASAGAVVFLLRSRFPFWQGNPRNWLAQTRFLSGWLTATALVGQIQTLLVSLLIGGRLSPAAVSGLRMAQTTLLQPVQNFQLAVQSLFVPRLSRLAGAAAAGAAATSADGTQTAAADSPSDTAPAEAVRQLRAQVAKVALAFTGLAVLTVAVLWPGAEFVLSRIDKFANVAPLALPISLQAGIYLVQVPFTSALRGMHRVRLQFLWYLLFAAVSLTGLMIGAWQHSLLGATWGLATGSITGLVTMVGFYLLALRDLGRGAQPATHS